MSSRIEDIITEIEEYVEGAKQVPLSPSKITVNKDELLQFLKELRLKVPDEIKKYQRMLSNKDSIIADARSKAEAIINEAQIQRDELINEHEIMQNAYKQANEVVEEAVRQAQAIIDQANLDAITMRESAIGYTDDLLSNVQNIIERSFDASKASYENLLDTLQLNLNTVVDNRKELNNTSESNGVIDEDDTDVDGLDDLDLDLK